MNREFHAVNPASGENLEPTFGVSSASELEGAVAAASSAVDALADPEIRATFLERVADEIEIAADTIVERAGRETALPEARLRGELARTTGQLRLFADVVREGSWVDARIDRADPDRTPAPRPDVRSMMIPVGPVAVFGASNFPLAFSVAGGDSASAWAAGNPVIVKAHPAHPGTSRLVGDAIERALVATELPGGVFGLLFDDGHQVGIQLVQHPGIKAVGFTGSQAGGLALARLARERPEPIPVFAEMGSVNPVVVLPDALADSVEEIATGLFGSCTLGVGQFCTNPGLVFVPEGSRGDALVARLGELAAAAELPAMLTAGIAENYERCSEALGERGARLVAEGAGTAARIFECELDAVTKHPDLLAEVFGPSTLVVRWSEPGRLIRCIETMDGQLTATLHASESDDSDEIWRALAGRSGRVLFGGYPTGVEVNHAMVHGGPWPATSDGASTSVGTRAIRRFARPLAYQNAPESLLPPELREDNPRGIWRLVDGDFTR
jgi:NADP-dependent aldehyde dehydrogenase